MNDLSSSAILTSTDLHFRAQQAVLRSRRRRFPRRLWGFYKEIRAVACHPDSKQQCEPSHPWRQIVHMTLVEKRILLREFSHGGYFVFLFWFLTVELQDCFLIITS